MERERQRGRLSLESKGSGLILSERGVLSRSPRPRKGRAETADLLRPPSRGLAQVPEREDGGRGAPGRDRPRKGPGRGEGGERATSQCRKRRKVGLPGTAPSRPLWRSCCHSRKRTRFPPKHAPCSPDRAAGPRATGV